MSKVSIPELVSAADAAKSLSVTRDVVWKWAQRGKIEPVRLGRALFFAAKDVKALRADIKKNQAAQRRRDRRWE